MTARKNEKGEAERLALKMCRLGLARCGGGFGLDVDPAAVLVERDLAVREGEQGPIAAGADVLAGEELGAALADQDAAGGDELAAVTFYTQPLAYAITSVADAALTFLVCHMPVSVKI